MAQDRPLTCQVPRPTMGILALVLRFTKVAMAAAQTVLPEQIQTCALVKEANSGFMSWTRRPALTAWAGSQKLGAGTTTETLFWSFVRLSNVNKD